MFERFTERARQVVILAQEEAGAADLSSVVAPCILAGLIREEEGLAARALAAREVTIEKVRAGMAGWPAGPAAEPPVGGLLPFTSESKQALEYALREALALGHNYIGTEHILLGLERIPGVDELGVDETVREEVMRWLAGKPPPRSSRSRGDGPPLGKVTLVEDGDGFVIEVRVTVGDAAVCRLPVTRVVTTQAARGYPEVTLTIPGVRRERRG